MRLFKKVSFPFFSLIIIVAFSWCPLTFAHAQTPSVQTLQMGFDVMPRGQRVQKGYFNFTASGHHTYSLPVQLVNRTDHELKIKVRRLNALTSIYGNIQYVSYTQGFNTKLLSQTRAMKTYLKGPSDVALPAHAQKTLYFYVRTPSLSGTLLGGLSFESDASTTQHTHAGNNKRAFSLQNKVQRIIGIELNYSTHQANVMAKKPVVATTPSGAFVFFKLKNGDPAIAKHIKMSYQVSQNGKPLFNGTARAFEMAPNSEIGYPASWKTTFKPGTYHARVTLKMPSETLTKHFLFHVSDANSANLISQTSTKTTTVVANTVPWWMVFLIISLILIVLILLLLFVLTKRRENKAKKNNGKSVDETQKR